MTARKITPKRPADAPRHARHPKLDDATKIEIVTRLACYDPVVEIVADLAQRGITVSAQAVSHYNPASMRPLAQRWRTLFDETRAEYLAEMTKVPIANRIWRLKRLERLLRKAESSGAVALAQSILEQAAKEVGQVYSNVTKSTAVVAHHHTHEVSADERRNMLEDRFAAAINQVVDARSGSGKTTTH